MEKLLIPVDFSENAVNAALYAVSLATQMNLKGIILYHSTKEKSHSDKEVREQFKRIGERIGHTDIEVEYVSNAANLTDGLIDLAEAHHFLLVVMGMTGQNKIGQKLIGSNVFRVSQNMTVPVLVIPAETRFERIKNIGLALPILPDMKSYVPEIAIKSILEKLGANLMVVNVGEKSDNRSKATLYAGLNDIFLLFDELDPSYHFLNNKNTLNSLLEFSEDNHVDILISISGKEGILQRLLKPSISKNLVYRSQTPLLLYKAKSNK